MSDILSGLKDLGLEELEGKSLFETEPKKEQTQRKEPPKEEDFILSHSVTCPVCAKMSAQKMMKSGKAKLLSVDRDLRPVYEFIDCSKYDVYMCNHCGYAALAKYFVNLLPKQIKDIRDRICASVIIPNGEDGAYSYEYAIKRYRLALACALVKNGRDSEKAFLCLKFAWLLRGYCQRLEMQTEGKNENRAQLLADYREMEKEYLQKAYHGFDMASQKESFPMCGMDFDTVNYLRAALAFEIGQIPEAKLLLSKILTSAAANKRVKDRARVLKDVIVGSEKKG